MFFNRLSEKKGEFPFQSRITMPSLPLVLG